MKTFLLPDQSNTLGMVLNKTLLEREEVSFCACFVRHPDDSHLEVKLETKEEGKEEDVLRASLSRIQRRFQSLFEEYFSLCSKEEANEVSFFKSKMEAEVDGVNR